MTPCVAALGVPGALLCVAVCRRHRLAAVHGSQFPCHAAVCLGSAVSASQARCDRHSEHCSHIPRRCSAMAEESKDNPPPAERVKAVRGKLEKACAAFLEGKVATVDAVAAAWAAFQEAGGDTFVVRSKDPRLVALHDRIPDLFASMSLDLDGECAGGGGGGGVSSPRAIPFFHRQSAPPAFTVAFTTTGSPWPASTTGSPWPAWRLLCGAWCDM